MIRKSFYFLLVVALGVVIWGAFGLWTGIYSIYTIPPSKQNADGATLVVTREEGEPMFNSPDYTPRPKKPGKQSGLVFAPMVKAKRSVDDRTIMKLPYVGWTYKKSLETQEESP